MRPAQRRFLGLASKLGITAAATAALSEPICKWLTHQGRIDLPNHRSSHRQPVPRGGGLAGILAATATALTTPGGIGSRNGASILSLAALGWLDDATGHIPARVRLAGQLGAGATCLSHSAPDSALAAATTAGVVNVVNFMDGINGISALTAMVWGTNAMLMQDDSPSHLANLGALTAGAALGFLPFNVPSAKMFMGDVGSYALGGVMAAGILSQHTIGGRYEAGAPLLLYAADAAQAICRRKLDGAKLSEAHRDHVYQKLVDAGHSHLAVAALHATGAALAAISSRMPGPARWAVPSALCAAYIALPTVDSHLARTKVRHEGCNRSRLYWLCWACGMSRLA